MTHTESSPNHFTVDHFGSQLMITITHNRPLKPLLRLLFGIGVTAVFATQFISKQAKISEQFIRFWLTSWLLTSLFVLFLLVWRTFGVETIDIDALMMRVTRQIGCIGYTKTYQTSLVRELQTCPAVSKNDSFMTSLHSVLGGTISFNHVSQIIRFGVGLNKADAQEIVQNIQLQHSFMSL